MTAADVQPDMNISIPMFNESGEVLMVTPTKGSNAYVDIYFKPRNGSKTGRKLKGVWKKAPVVVHG